MSPVTISPAASGLPPLPGTRGEEGGADVPERVAALDEFTNEAQSTDNSRFVQAMATRSASRGLDQAEKGILMNDLAGNPRLLGNVATLEQARHLLTLSAPWAFLDSCLIQGKTHL